MLSCTRYGSTRSRAHGSDPAIQRRMAWNTALSRQPAVHSPKMITPRLLPTQAQNPTQPSPFSIPRTIEWRSDPTREPSETPQSCWMTDRNTSQPTTNLLNGKTLRTNDQSFRQMDLPMDLPCHAWVVKLLSVIGFERWRVGQSRDRRAIRVCRRRKLPSTRNAELPD